MNRQEQLADWLQLINCEHVGPITFFKLLNNFGSAAEALSELPRFSKYKLFPRADALREIELAERKGIQIIPYYSELYPDNLKQLEDAPPLIYIKGNAKILKHPLGLSIVGARNASINGRKTASHIAYDLTNNNVLIISGMARGIDSAAHKGAMHAKQQQGETIAVLGTGIDVIYPQENTELYNQIAEQGAIISEFPLGTTAQANNFPRRNRIVAALSLGTLVVEATLHSGSLITAKLALDQGKDIFAIPGSPQDARALGPNKLIKDGAVLVENAEDILQVLSVNNQKQINQYVDNLQKNADIPQLLNINQSPQTEDISIVDLLSPEGVSIDEIIRMSGLSASEVSLALLELELTGRIERQNGNKVALIK